MSLCTLQPQVKEDTQRSSLQTLINKFLMESKLFLFLDTQSKKKKSPAYCPGKHSSICTSALVSPLPQKLKQCSVYPGFFQPTVNSFTLFTSSMRWLFPSIPQWSTISLYLVLSTNDTQPQLQSHRSVSADLSCTECLKWTEWWRMVRVQTAVGTEQLIISTDTIAQSHKTVVHQGLINSVRYRENSFLSLTFYILK